MPFATLPPRLLTALILALVLPLSDAEAAPDPAPIHAGSELDYPPFAVVKPDGTADGFSVDLLRATLQAMGRKVEFKVAPWHELKRDLAEGRLHVLPLVARSAERHSAYDFSVPYFTMHGTLVVRKGETRIRDVADLKDREVIVMHEDIADEYLMKQKLTTHIFRTDTVEQALRQLANGEHDAVLVQKLTAEALIHSLGLRNLETVGTPITDYQYFCFAVREGDQELLAMLNEGLALVIANGTYAQLQDKWLAALPKERNPYLQMTLAVVITLSLAWVVALLWQQSLLRLVQARTTALRDANVALLHEINEHDGTERALRRKTEELEAMFANVHMNLAIMDRDFNFLRVNAGYAASAGKKPEDFSGLNHFILYPDADDEAIFRRVVETGEPYHIHAKPLDHPVHPGQTTYWDWTLTPVTGANGEVEGVVLALIDATERERQRQEVDAANRLSNELLERRVRERTNELRAAYQELETFSYSVSHDLRGPLRAINGFSEALAEDFDDELHPAARSYIARIRNATVRMGELIDGLLNLARVFRSEVKCSEVNLSELGKEIMALLQAAYPEVQASFRIQPHMSALGDPALLRVLVQNLLGNAIKFSRHRPQPEIEFGAVTLEGQTVFHVRDNGLGFEMQYAHKLFQPFERLHDDNQFEGTGIGLATVRRIVLRHGGRVWAEGAPDRGATLYFTLEPKPAKWSEAG